MQMQFKVLFFFLVGALLPPTALAQGPSGGPWRATPTPRVVPRPVPQGGSPGGQWAPEGRHPPMRPDGFRRPGPPPGAPGPAPGRPPHAGRGSSFSPPVMDPETEEVLLAWIGEDDPELLAELKLVRVEDPGRYHQRIRELEGEWRHLEALKQRDPGRYEKVVYRRKLEIKARGLARSYRKRVAKKGESARSTGAAKETRKSLHSLLQELFELREAERMHEIERLETELSRLKELSKKRAANKKEIVSRHLREILGEADDLIW